MNGLFEGVMTPLFTPMDSEERIIEEDLIKLTERMLKAGVSGFLTPSGTGETATLSLEECRRHVEIVASVAKGRAFIVSLQVDCSTKQLLKKFEAAAEVGADAVMANPPYYYRLNKRGLEKFYTDLATESRLPVWIYNQPYHTKVNVEPDTVAKLARNAGIVGIKDSAGPDMYHYQKVLRATKEHPKFRVLIGEDVNVLCALALGGHGMVSTLSNIIPEAFVGLYKTMKEGDLEKAREFQRRITDVDEALIEGWPYPHSSCKYVLKHMGVFSSEVAARPDLPLTRKEKQKIDKILDKLNLLD